MSPVLSKTKTEGWVRWLHDAQKEKKSIRSKAVRIYDWTARARAGVGSSSSPYEPSIAEAGKTPKGHIPKRHIPKRLLLEEPWVWETQEPEAKRRCMV